MIAFARDAHGAANLDSVRDFFVNRFLTLVTDSELLVVDLAGVATLDSSCLGPLAQKLKDMQGQEGRLTLCGVDAPALKEILALTSFDKVIPIYRTRDDAVRALTI